MYTGQSFIRKRHVIKFADGAIYKSHFSISDAKRTSRILQRGGAKVEVDHSEDPKPQPRRDSGDAADRFLAKAMREMHATKLLDQQQKSSPGLKTLVIRK